MAIGAGPGTEHRRLAGGRADPTVPSGLSGALGAETPKVEVAQSFVPRTARRARDRTGHSARSRYCAKRPQIPWIKQPEEVCSTADTITDRLPAQSDLEELAKLCQQIDRACRIMYELSDPRQGLAAEGTAFGSRLLDEGQARLRDLVGQLDATSARLCKMPDFSGT